ncbi:MAG: hypothetical protein ABEH40_01290 [Haloferacaceae archaeon]
MSDAPDRDLDDVVTVTNAGITVEKRFTTDEFPVPAVKFDLRSEADEPVEVRLIDEIPDSFDMEGVGFHPEYDSEAWTAYRDHRVEYERTIDPGEAVTTVYGVRLDDRSSGTRFLGDPRIERVSEAGPAAAPEDILGRETTESVREALAGDGDLAAGADPPGTAAAGEGEAADLTLDDPASAGDDGGAGAEGAGASGVEGGDIDLDDPDPADGEAVADEADEGIGEIELDEPGASGTADADAAADGPAPRSLDSGLTPAVEPGEVTADAGSAGGEGADGAEDAGEGGAAPPGALPGSVAAALAAEIREGAADDDDLAVLREAIAADVEPEIPTSLEVRIDRLQNRTEDLAAYTDALEAFLDEEGTAREVLDDLEDRSAALREDLDAVASETADLDDAVADHDDRLETVEATADDLSDGVASLESGLDDLGSRVEDLEASLDDLAGDTDASVEDLRGTLDDVEATIADVEDEIEDLQSFRDRMRDAFGS